MASISSPGIGSGLDINSIITQLMSLERRPIEQIGLIQQRLKAEISSMGKVKSAFSQLQDAARALASSDSYSGTKAVSSNAEAVAATASTSASAGTYAINVTALAKPQVVTSPTFGGSSDPAFDPATTYVGEGNLTIVEGNGTQTTITLTPSDSSLNSIRDKINAAGIGVTASIVSDLNGYRLSLRAKEAGTANAFQVTVNPDNEPFPDTESGLSLFDYPPTASGAGLRTQLAQAASNATATINGVSVTLASNTLQNVVDGLTLDLKKEGGVTVTVSRDAEATKKKITDFVDAYNSAVTTLRTATRYDEATKTAGDLQGNQIAVSLLNRLRAAVGGSSSASTGFTRLSDIGLSQTREGTLTVNSTKLDAAIAKVDDLKSFLAGAGTGTAAGIAVQFGNMTTSVLGTDGTIENSEEAAQRRVSETDRQKKRLEDRLALVEKRLRDQYTKLDANISGLTALSSYVGQQVTAWNKK